MLREGRERQRPASQETCRRREKVSCSRVEDEREIIMAVLSKSASIASPRREALRYGIAAIMLGIVFIGVAGFAPLQAIHDAAHNTRHAITFPCH